MSGAVDEPLRQERPACVRDTQFNRNRRIVCLSFMPTLRSAICRRAPKASCTVLSAVFEMLSGTKRNALFHCVVQSTVLQQATTFEPTVTAHHHITRFVGLIRIRVGERKPELL